MQKKKSGKAKCSGNAGWEIRPKGQSQGKRNWVQKDGVAVSNSEIWERIRREKAATGTWDAGTKGNVGHSKQDEMI